MTPQEITKAREARGWTQTKLARMANVTPAALNRIEQGHSKPLANTIRKIQAALGGDFVPDSFEEEQARERKKRAQAFKAMRIQRGLSTQEAAELANLDPNTIRRLEEGRYDAIGAEQLKATYQGIEAGNSCLESFSKALLAFRTKQGLSQRALAKLVGVAPTTIRGLEDPGLHRFTPRRCAYWSKRIANKLGYPVKDFGGNLVEDHLDILESVAKRMHPTLKAHYDIDDLKSLGFPGLQQAAERYQHGMGVPFRTYAWHRVKGAILDATRKNTGLGAASRAVAGKRLVTGGHQEQFVEPAAHTIEGLDNYQEILKDLSTRERFVFDQHYLWGLNMAEIGDMLGITESRVCQIHTLVLRRLRKQTEHAAG